MNEIDVYSRSSKVWRQTFQGWCQYSRCLLSCSAMCGFHIQTQLTVQDDCRSSSYCIFISDGRKEDEAHSFLLGMCAPVLLLTHCLEHGNTQLQGRLANVIFILVGLVPHKKKKQFFGRRGEKHLCNLAAFFYYF